MAKHLAVVREHDAVGVRVDAAAGARSRERGFVRKHREARSARLGPGGPQRGEGHPRRRGTLRDARQQFGRLVGMPPHQRVEGDGPQHRVLARARLDDRAQRAQRPRRVARAGQCSGRLEQRAHAGLFGREERARPAVDPRRLAGPARGRPPRAQRLRREQGEQSLERALAPLRGGEGRLADPAPVGRARIRRGFGGAGARGEPARLAGLDRQRVGLRVDPEARVGVVGVEHHERDTAADTIAEVERVRPREVAERRAAFLQVFDGHPPVRAEREVRGEPRPQPDVAALAHAVASRASSTRAARGAIRPRPTTRERPRRGRGDSGRPARSIPRAVHGVRARRAATVARVRRRRRRERVRARRPGTGRRPGAREPLEERDGRSRRRHRVGEERVPARRRARRRAVGVALAPRGRPVAEQEDVAARPRRRPPRPARAPRSVAPPTRSAVGGVGAQRAHVLGRVRDEAGRHHVVSTWKNATRNSAQRGAVPLEDPLSAGRGARRTAGPGAARHVEQEQRARGRARRRAPAPRVGRTAANSGSRRGGPRPRATRPSARDVRTSSRRSAVEANRTRPSASGAGVTLAGSATAIVTTSGSGRRRGNSRWSTRSSPWGSSVHVVGEDDAVAAASP